MTFEHNNLPSDFYVAHALAADDDSLSSSLGDSPLLTPTGSFEMDVDDINTDNVFDKAVDLVSIGPAWFSKFGSKSMSDQHYPHDLEIELYRAQVEYFPESFPTEWTELHQDQRDMVLYKYFPNDQVRGKFFEVLQDIPGASDPAREAMVNYTQAVVQAMLKRLEEIWNKDSGIGNSISRIFAQPPVYWTPDRDQRDREQCKQDDYDAIMPSEVYTMCEGMPTTMLSVNDYEDQHKKMNEASDLMNCIKSLQALCNRIALGVDPKASNLKSSAIIDRVNKMELYLQDQLTVLREFRKDVLNSSFLDLTPRKKEHVEKKEGYSPSCLALSPVKRARVVSEEFKQQDESFRSPKKQARAPLTMEDAYEGVVRIGMCVDGSSPFRPRPSATISL